MKTLSTEKHVKAIFDLISEGVTERQDIFSRAFNDVQITDRTKDKYLAIARNRFLEYQNSIISAKATQHTNEVLQAEKRGLKSKIQRVMEKQADVDRLRAMVESGKTSDVFFDRTTGTPVEFEREMTTGEKATILRHATAIEAEISKIMDDYPIQKHQVQASVIHVAIAPDNQQDNETEDADYTIPEVEWFN